ncbi:hypothetical protein T484DRAFT_1821701 [Baffinella frigidus]|nr:hypothetical protein T484DRAFT_1821701 [Cryptophyta sp. CCMP2293]
MVWVATAFKGNVFRFDTAAIPRTPLWVATAFKGNVFRFDTSDIVQRLPPTLPVLVLHGNKDMVLPHAYLARLEKAAASPKDMILPHAYLARLEKAAALPVCPFLF